VPKKTTYPTYELTIESGTKFYDTPEVKYLNDALGYYVRDEIVEGGFQQYEVSNYGRYRSIHNLGYWSLKSYIGVGAGAVGFLDNMRLYPHRDISRYIDNPTWSDVEMLTRDDIITEKIFLGLRSEVGLERDILTPDMQRRADHLVKFNRLKLEGGVYKNSNFFLSDELTLSILTD